MKLISIFVSVLVVNLSFAQSSKDDLDFVFENLQNSASYKTQKSRQQNVVAKYKEIRKQRSSLSVIESYMKLYELADEILDYHNEIYGNAESFSYSDVQNAEFLQNIRNSPQYNFYPKSKLNLDSLEIDLSKRKLTDHEGIYHHQDYFKIAIVKRPDNILEGIVLETKIPSWQRGETILYLLPKQDDRFRLFSGKFIDKTLFSTIDRFADGEFKTARWRKKLSKGNHYDVGYPEQTFVIDHPNPKFTYVKLGSFSSSNKGIKEATEFYNEISSKITSENLIIDVRNNSGGGEKSSTPFLKLFKRFRGNIYVFTNFYTVSNAEQFVVKMKARKNVTVLGDRTRGMLTYGHNYNGDKETPSNKFRIYFSDMKDNWRDYLKYEGVGVEPDVYLKSEEDWVRQVVEKYSR